MAFAPDGQTLASAAGDHSVRLWHVSDGAQLRTLATPDSPVTCVAFAPDGQLLVAGLDDGRVQLWG